MEEGHLCLLSHHQLCSQLLAFCLCQLDLYRYRADVLWCDVQSLFHSASPQCHPVLQESLGHGGESAAASTSSCASSSASLAYHSLGNHGCGAYICACAFPYVPSKRWQGLWDEVSGHLETILYRGAKEKVRDVPKVQQSVYAFLWN